jgi:hypothetical protein
MKLGAILVQTSQERTRNLAHITAASHEKAYR